MRPRRSRPGAIDKKDERMPDSRAVVATAHASRYLQQLCKHWAHKFETEFTPTVGRIVLTTGEARLSADADALTVTLVAADEDALAQLRDVVASHLGRFAFRETLRFEWT
jgi:hypothetical protein